MSSDPDLRLLRYFVAVAETLHFGRAAETLFVSQPTLSSQVRKLEANLGVDLFLRDRRRVALTDAGRLLLPPAREVLAAGEGFGAAATRLRRVARRELVVGFHVRWPHDFLPRVLRRARASLPEMEVTLAQHDFTDTSAGLANGSSDVALLHLPLDLGGLQVIEAAQEPRVAIVAEDHPLAMAGQVRVDDLAASGTPWAVPRSEDRAWRDFWGAESELRAAGIRRVGPLVEIATQEALLQQVAGGAVLALTYRSLIATYQPGGVRALDVAGLAPGRLGIAWVEEPPGALLAGFLDAVREELRGPTA
ncbi:LysR family transcriptional regulator [Euzebya tangerina]|uniref:LysR family transcriptional regulator n=1 Tax=Euzebya tangerina TaxID=591198 RepID=UPI000E31C2CD|nr:LysR substrate-binding domain-containing protein [Euzebya tangerina]